ncbi:MAG TPA: hypothetical protein VHR66_07035 [Gemmataceae bacterium]|jgi:hypothetical protein|nr:hypothetical protein [Gemmataceae bacterium]
MSRQTLAAVAILGLALVSATNAISEEPKSKTLYFPTTVGDRLVFDVKSGDNRFEKVDEVTSAKSQYGANLVEIRTTIKDGTPTTAMYEVSDKGVYQVMEGSNFLPGRACLVRLPLMKGDTWEWKMTAKESEPAKGQQPDMVEIIATCTVVGEEEIEVGAGKFKVARVEMSFEFMGFTTRVTSWLAPGRGPVRVQIESGESIDSLKTDVMISLKSFTPGKK